MSQDTAGLLYLLVLFIMALALASVLTRNVFGAELVLVPIRSVFCCGASIF